MRSRNIFLGILIILFSFASHSAVAQNIFEKDVENRNIKNLSQDPRALDPKLRHSEASPEGYRLRSQEERTENIAPNISRHAVNVYAPMAGLSDTLFSQAHADQLSTILSSPVVLYSTTMLLTEPAVAGGVNNALSHAHGSLHSRYLAEEQFMRQLDSNPETKQVSLRNYSDCVANYIRERTKFPVQPGSPPMPDFTNDTVSWIEAQSKCMADRIKSVDSIGGTQFNQVGDTPTALTGKGFDFANEITNPKFHNNSTATGLEDSQIYLTDYIFNQFDYSSFGVSILGLRSAFEQLLGNYIFTLDRETGGVRSASRELKYRKTAPTRPRDEWLLEKEESIYGKLMFILGEYCSFQPAPTTTRNTGFPDEYTFCKSDPSVENTLMAFSLPNFW